MKRALGAILLLLAAGCDRMVLQGPAPVYAPWEEGITLAYLDPSQPGAPRQQVRVKKCENTPEGQLVVKTFSSLTSESEASYRYANGLVAQRLDSQQENRLLPEGFPDRVSSWEDRGTQNHVVGRARVNLPGIRLPDPDVAGVWVESVTAGARRRTLYVPDLGEVETMNLKNGKWVTVNRLVSLGFTDPPPQGSEK